MGNSGVLTRFPTYFSQSPPSLEKMGQRGDLSRERGGLSGNFSEHQLQRVQRPGVVREDFLLDRLIDTFHALEFIERRYCAGRIGMAVVGADD
jgi:hypothetical protein